MPISGRIGFSLSGLEQTSKDQFEMWATHSKDPKPDNRRSLGEIRESFVGHRFIPDLGYCESIRLHRLRKKGLVVSFRAKRRISLRFKYRKRNKEGFFASLRMTKIRVSSATCSAAGISEHESPTWL